MLYDMYYDGVCYNLSDSKEMRKYLIAASTYEDNKLVTPSRILERLVSNSVLFENWKRFALKKTDTPETMACGGCEIMLGYGCRAQAKVWDEQTKVTDEVVSFVTCDNDMKCFL